MPSQSQNKNKSQTHNTVTSLYVGKFGQIWSTLYAILILITPSTISPSTTTTSPNDGNTPLNDDEKGLSSKNYKMNSASWPWDWLRLLFATIKTRKKKAGWIGNWKVRIENWETRNESWELRIVCTNQN